MTKVSARISMKEMDSWQIQKGEVSELNHKSAESQKKTKALAFLPPLWCILQNII